MRMGLLVVFAVLACLAVPSVSAEQAVYIAMNPDSEFCDSIIFGEDGKGEYTLDITDPGYPDRSWVKIHRASFTAGPLNPVIVPVCFHTWGRAKGDEAVLNVNLETPKGNISLDYGICVSDFEDVDVGVVGDNPCEATIVHTDIFSMDLLESDIYARRGESVSTGLLVSSDMYLTVNLDKVSGPSMSIGMTTVQLPGQERIEIGLEAPDTEGTYDFTISGKVDGCDKSSCEKTVTGNIHVTESQEGFSVYISQKNRNVIGTHSVTYFLTIDNMGDTGKFKVTLETDENIETDFGDMEITIAGGTKRILGIVVVPKAVDNKVHVIKASVEDESGAKKVAEAYLTIDEAVSDVNRAEEKNPDLKDDEYRDDYESDWGLEDWEQKNEEITENEDDDDEPEEPQEVGWIVWVVAAGAIAGVSVYYIYRKTKVTDELSQDGYEPLDS